MKKLALDISTTSTGAVIQRDNDPITTYKLFTSNKKDQMDRIQTMAKEIINWVQDKEFDIMIVTQARTKTIIKGIAMLEGIVLGEAIKRNIKVDYYPDSAWYLKIGDRQDERPTKKANSLKRYILRNNLKEQIKKINGIKIIKKFSHYDENTKQAVYKTIKKVDKLDIELKSGEIITDDIADAFNASDLYEKRQLDYEFKTLIDELQIKKNKLRSSNKKINKRLDIIKQQKKYLRQELTLLKKEYALTKFKRTVNSIDSRTIKIADLEVEEINLMQEKTDNLNKVKELTDKQKK